jgi:hypothetical protein
VLKKPAEALGLRKLNLQVLRCTIATLAQTKGNVKDVQGILGHQQPRDHRRRLHADDRGGRQADAGRDLCGADEVAEVGNSSVNGKNLVRFGTVGFSSNPQVIVPQGLGA